MTQTSSPVTADPAERARAILPCICSKNPMADTHTIHCPGNFRKAVERELRRPAQSTRDAVIEECAKIAEAQAQEFLSPGYASNQPFGSTCERFACNEVAKAIRALALTSTVQQPVENKESGAS